ncbi:MAG: peptidylprolyl isomerase [Spirochaetales bacterium]|nr:peptidylprolyl isomerase [Spirochaetales bacterium]
MTINDRVVPQYMFDREFDRLSRLQAEAPEHMRVPEEELKIISERNVVGQFLFLLKAEKEVPQINEEELEKALKKMVKQYPKEGKPDQEKLQIIRRDLEGQLRQEAFFKELFSDISITEEEAEKAFQENRESFCVPEQVHCSHILCFTSREGDDPNRALQTILEAQKELNQGKPFDLVARKYSDEKIIDLETFPRGSLTEKFEKVVFNLEPGKVSEIFQTDLGYHIALVHKKIPSLPLEFEKIKSDVIKGLENSARDQIVADLLEELKASAKIEK